MKTKHIIFSAIVAIFFATAFAGESQITLVFDTQAIDGISTVNGEFADLQGLQEGALSTSGVGLADGKIKIDLTKSGSKLDSVYLNNGKILSLGREAVSAAMGGEMGGGGK